MKRILTICVFITICISLLNAKDTYPCPSPLRFFDKCAVSSIYQDATYAIWINSELGLYRYDGYQLRQVDSRTSSQHVCFNGVDKIYYIIDEEITCLDTKTESRTSIKIPAGKASKKYTLYADEFHLFAALGQEIHTVKNDSLVPLCSIPISAGKIQALHSSPTEGIFLAGTSKGDLLEFNSKGEVSIINNFNDPICAIFTDSCETIFIGFENKGYAHLSAPYDLLYLHSLPGCPRKVRLFTETQDGTIFIGSLDGLFKIGRDYSLEKELTYMPNGHAVSSLMADIDGNIWAGTFYSGIILFPQKGYPFRNIELPKNSKIQLIGGLAEDAHGNIWIATDRYGIFCYSPKTDSFRKIGNTDDSKFKCISYNKESNSIWLGEYKGHLHRYDITTGRFYHYYALDRRGRKIDISIYDIVFKDHRIYLATGGGVYTFDYATEQAISHKLQGLNSFVYTMTTDKNGKIWLASKGVYYIEDGEIFDTGFPDTYIYSSVISDSAGNVWASCVESGVVKLSDNMLSFYNRETCGLGSNSVYELCQTNDGTLIFGTESGISIYDTARNACSNYSSDNGLRLGSTKDGHALVSSDGTIYFGGTEGLIVINPSDIENSYRKTGTHIDRVTINGKGVSSSAFDSKRMRLKYTENNLTFYLTDNNYTGVQPNFCRYFLKGHSQEWVQVNNGESIAFSSLRPGKYCLILHHSSFLNGDRYVEDQLKFRIRPPWYVSPIAIVLYLIFIIIAGAILFHLNKKSILKDERFRAKEQENAEKMKFFINLSHELRTPLTLIIGQLELLSKEQNLSRQAEQNITSTLDKAQKMNKIISDLLDFEKINQCQSRLYIRNTDMVKFLQFIVDGFAQYAEYKKVSLSFKYQSDSIPVMIDHEQMRKVIHNLLINSFKFTPELGYIAVRLKKTTSKMAVIEIEDSGCGISEDALERIFNPFYQDPLSENSKRSQGTGIGLALSKSIIELHTGTITAANSKTGGAIFTIELPTDHDWHKDNPLVFVVEKTVELSTEMHLIETNEYSDSSSDDTTKMLIVEDDNDMRSMLNTIFSNKYCIFEAHDGQEGLNIAQRENPDIIICDVMMPIMDGFTFCHRIKENFATCHIPVILLTAYDSEQNNIESINAGADDFISKPFSIDLLKKRCRSLLDNRDRLRKKFSSNNIGVEYITKDQRDKDFLTGLTKYIEENITDYKLNVNSLCEHMAMSRTILTEKLKGLTGYTPREFIEMTRFKYAAVLLKESDMTISEISYEAGFNSQKYFSSRFRKQFGKTPSEYRNS